VIISRWFTRCWGFVVPQVSGAWVIDLAEVGFGFTGYYGVNRHGYREDWGYFRYPRIPHRSAGMSIVIQNANTYRPYKYLSMSTSLGL